MSIRRSVGRRGAGPRRSAVIAGLAAAAALLLGSCSSPDPATGGDATPATVRVAYGPGFGSLPVLIAKEKGYFAANGLNVELTEGLDLASYLAAMGQQFDIVMGFPSSILQAASRRVPLTVISGLQRTDDQHSNNPLVVPQDSPIRSSADLVGKTVGVPTLTGIAAEAVRFTVRKQTGGDAVKLVMVPPDAMGDQLKAGRIDAAVSAIPYYTALRDRGFRILGDVVQQAAALATNGAQKSPALAAFMTTPAYADEYPDVVAAWRKSLQQGIDFIKSNEAEARAILQKHVGLTDTVARTAPLPAFDASFTAEDFAPFVTISTTIGTLATVPELPTLIYKEK